LSLARSIWAGTGSAGLWVPARNMPSTPNWTGRSDPGDPATAPQIAIPKDAIEDTRVIHPRHAAQLVGQHRLDGSPFLIGGFVARD
jgi:hypothetical protein